MLVQPVELPRILGHIAYLNLVNVREDSARQRLMTALKKNGQVDPARGSLRGRTRRVVDQANRNRSAMLDKVRAIWITGFLQRSLFHETRIILGLSDRPGRSSPATGSAGQVPDQSERPLLPRTRVVDVFDTVDRALLILGAARPRQDQPAPGAGP